MSVLVLLTIFLFAFEFVQAQNKGIYFEADLLYWKANEDGLSYAEKVNSQNQDAKDLGPDFEWDYGFKFGIGYRLPHGNWDVLLRLTHLHTHTDATSKAGEGEGFHALWIIPFAADVLADQVKMHWRLHFAFVDALLGKQLTLNSRCILYPQIGLRYACVRQKFNLEYRGGDLTPEEEDSIRIKNKFWGVGPYADFGIEWLLSRHFSLCAKGGIAGLYGQFYLHEDQDLLSSDVKILGFKDTFNRLVPIVDGTILLRWRPQKKFTFQIGWDGILLFNQNRMVRFADSSSNASSIQNKGDLGLSGLEAGFIYKY